MATINVSESDFLAAASGAHALSRDGDHEAAAVLDKLARKINAALSSGAVRVPGFVRTKLRWDEVPSVFDGFPSTAGAPDEH